MMSSPIVLLLLWLLSSSTALLLLCDGTLTPHIICSEKEKTALLNFKQGLTWDPSNKLLSSWSGLQQDCCTWTGVRCNNLTGRVIHLYLSNPYTWRYDDYESYETHMLGGKISPSLVELESLSYLDLSFNNFSGSTIPSFFGNMPSLRYLNLSNALFEGLIPHALGNLSSVRVLDLKYNGQLIVDDLSWIAGLHSLEYLDMSWVDLHRAINWVQEVSMLPSLSQLHLSECQLDKMIPPLAFVNFTSLEVLHLSGNHLNWKILHLLINHTRSLKSLDLFNNSLYGHIPSSISNLPLLRHLSLADNLMTGQIPDDLGQLKHLESLSLYGNSLYGPIPASIGNLSSLRELDLSDNSLYGPIPSFIGNLSSLRGLYLSGNQLNGTIPTSMGFLSNLEALSVSHNSLGGFVSEINFAKLSKLKYLYMSSNSIFFNVSSNWVPPFQLHRLGLSSCKMGPRIPTWLQTQTSLYSLDISQSGISGTAPEWLWKWVSGIDYIDLSGNQLNGDISNTLLNSTVVQMASNGFEGQLPRLSPNVKVLNLANNSFFGSISPFLCQEMNGESMLQVLDLSNNNLSGIMILHLLINHTRSLKSLDLFNNSLYGHIPSSISNLPLLRHLSLADNLMTGQIPDDLGQLKHLESLSLYGNSLYGPIPASIGNLSSLRELDLSDNSLYGPIPSFIGNLSSLRELDLSVNSLYGPIPSFIGNLSSLRELDLFGNSLYGPIPSFIGNLSSLRGLYLSLNQLNGTIPTSMGFLSNLEALSVSHNSLGGFVSEINFAKLSKLKYLYMSSNSIFFNVSSNWVPPFQLHVIGLSSCKMGPRFPTWLQTQTSLNYLEISQSGFSGTAPEWLWKWVSGIDYIDLSGNQLNGDISNTLLNSSVVQMASNCFEGQLPRLSPNVKMLNLANNSFFGSISPFLCQEMNGESMLQVLDLANNILSGEVSHCLMHWQHLEYLNIGSNHLSGKIPNSVGSLRFLTYLQLHNNTFLGEIPLSLRNCTHLRLINLGENEFTGLIPNWIGEMLDLAVLRLRSNKFIGNIPSKTCQLSYLTILDLGNNNISGPIPKCLKNISAMITTDTYSFDVLVRYSNNYGIFYRNILSLVTKGRELEYKDILGLVRSIDLSNNNLSGSIPYELFSLHALQSLNLSRNQITGKIPENIGGMTMLESFDISRNHLLGEIPQSMSNLTFLSYLDLSYNNLSGRIPSGTQLQSFNATSYIGNVELCGAPLNNNCTREEESQGRGVTSMEKEEEEYEMVWFYIGMGPGFVVGFWVVCGTLILKRTWRHAYFQHLENVKDWIYLAVLLKVNWLRRKFNRSNNA